jgi:hypothetical protein
MKPQTTEMRRLLPPGSALGGQFLKDPLNSETALSLASIHRSNRDAFGRVNVKGAL